jgi:hypothetical protein
MTQRSIEKVLQGRCAAIRGSEQFNAYAYAYFITPSPYTQDKELDNFIKHV